MQEKKKKKKNIQSMGHVYANDFSKAYIVCYRKMHTKKKITVSFPGKTPLKTNILCYTEHTRSNYWFYDPVNCNYLCQRWYFL